MKGAKKIDAVFVGFIGVNKISKLDDTIKVYHANKVAPLYRDRNLLAGFSEAFV
jgi:hypothetical protein